MKYVVGLPYRVKSFRDSLMATCKLENVFEIDNTENNIGFSASHNLGIQKMYDDGADWYIVMSAAVRFGEPGGLDFIEICNSSCVLFNKIVMSLLDDPFVFLVISLICS